MQSINCLSAFVIGLACLGGQTEAATVNLDFETAATGSGIATAPLVTAEGTITASASGGSIGMFTFGPGIGLQHTQARLSDSGFGLLAFNFDVTAILFDYYPDGGVGTFEALDASLNVVDSFFDSATFSSNTPVTLTGSAIRYFRWSDSPSIGSGFSGINNVTLTTATTTGPLPPVVPLPAAFPLFLVALGSLGFVARRRKSA